MNEDVLMIIIFVIVISLVIALFLAIKYLQHFKHTINNYEKKIDLYVISARDITLQIYHKLNELGVDVSSVDTSIVTNISYTDLNIKEKEKIHLLCSNFFQDLMKVDFKNLDIFNNEEIYSLIENVRNKFLEIKDLIKHYNEAVLTLNASLKFKVLDFLARLLRLKEKEIYFKG